MYVRVKYKNNTYDYVSGILLDKLIMADKIKQFYRYSEERWVTIGVDPVRGSGRGEYYTGVERRKSLLNQAVSP